MSRLALLALLGPASAWGWGERVHHAIARAAALHGELGAEAAALSGEDRRRLRAFTRLLRARALALGHLANIPDTAWRSGDAAARSLNAPTHFLNAETLGVEIGALPLDYAEARARHPGLFEAGTVFWRAQQLYELSVAQWRRAQQARPGSKEYQWAVYDALVYSGLLAHFVGDATMPFHNTADHDGCATGNGGIHAYFETETPLTDSPELELELWRTVPKAYADFGIELKFRSGGARPAAFLVRELDRQASGRIAELRKLDDTLVRRRGDCAAGGSAERPEPAAALPVFRPMIVEQAALSAAALARLWRGAWEQGGRPELERALKDHRYPHKPPFVDPDYDPDAVSRVRSAAGRRR